MMDKNEFFNYMREHIRTYLPAEYADARITTEETVKHNDVHLTALLIRQEGVSIVPSIYMDDLFRDYQNGRPVEDCLEAVAQLRVREEHNIRVHMDMIKGIMDYDNIKDRLQLRVCDYEDNKERLQGTVYERQGDLALTCHVLLESSQEMEAGFRVMESMLEQWGVDRDTVYQDALAADAKRGPVLHNMDDALGIVLYGSSNKENLLKREGTLDMEGWNLPLFVLTSQSGKNGAGMLYQPGMTEKLSELLGGDYYVLPSSVHELLVVPADGAVDAKTLESFVQEINAKEVDIQDRLSNKVQYYNAEGKTLVNAVAFEQKDRKLDVQKVSPVLRSIILACAAMDADTYTVKKGTLHFGELQALQQECRQEGLGKYIQFGQEEYDVQCKKTVTERFDIPAAMEKKTGSRTSEKTQKKRLQL
ncbi:hypothetical protein BN3660_01057 [Eubacteriaceae bacterium CHKCI004]|nr:hypothetical protein BN3660_01057 [Eubacteriaceae bacterium CHKCI004]